MCLETGESQAEAVRIVDFGGSELPSGLVMRCWRS
jgi:hypothetical protein